MTTSRSSASFSAIFRPTPARALRLATVGLAAAVLAGCGTAPLSYLYDRQVYYRAELHRYPLLVEQVDGASTTFRPLPITAGDHLVTFSAAPVGGFSQPVTKTYPMAIAPCTRYYVAAQRDSALDQDWHLVVEQTFSVAGCDPAKELAKAREAAAAGKQPPLTSAIESRTSTASSDATTPTAVH